MEIDNKSFSALSIKDLLLEDQHVILKNDMNKKQILNLLELIVDFENAYEKKNVKIQLDNFNFEQLMEVYTFIFDNLTKIRNISLLQNLIILLKSYNTFEDKFFESFEVFSNSIEQFLDLKTDLDDKIKKINFDIIQTFLSLMKSTTKLNYTEFDDYVELPIFYKIIFLGLDLYSIFGIFSTLDNNLNFKITLYKDANIYIDKLIDSYKLSNVLIDNFLKGIIK